MHPKVGQELTFNGYEIFVNDHTGPKIFHNKQLKEKYPNHILVIFYPIQKRGKSGGDHIFMNAELRRKQRLVVIIKKSLYTISSLVTHIQIIFFRKWILSTISKYIEIDPTLFSKRVFANDDTPY